MLEFDSYDKFRTWALANATYSVASNEKFESIEVRLNSKFPPECVIAFSYECGSMSQKMAQEVALKAMFEVYSSENRLKSIGLG